MILIGREFPKAIYHRTNFYKTFYAHEIITNYNNIDMIYIWTIQYNIGEHTYIRGKERMCTTNDAYLE
jgi:hypothetical protein